MKTNLNRITIALIAALALLGMTHNANAQITYFPDDATINYAVTGSAIVGYADQNGANTSTNGTSPTIDLVSGGSIGGNLVIANSSIVNITGGSISNTLAPSNESTVNISGGNIGGIISASQSAIINLRGGSFQTTNLVLKQNTTLNIFGTDLNATLISPNTGGFSVYTLSGSLLDGFDLTGKKVFTQNIGSATFNFNPGAPAVPEPGSVALLVGMMTVSTGILLRKRRK